MTDAVRLIARSQLQIYAAIGLLAAVYLVVFWRAHERLSRTPFGLEREVQLRRQNSSMIILTLLVVLATTIYVTNQVVLPRAISAEPTPTPVVLPTPTPSPVAAAQNIVVDSTGCDNPQGTLTAPKTGERIAGAFEVHGTANIPNLAFYKYEISGVGTNGEWLSLGVGTKPVVDGVLGTFDATAREPGNYAFRLVVLDSAGRYPPPCVITVTLVNLSPTAAATP